MRLDRTAPLPCPYCKAVNDAHATEPADAPPERGHLSLCIYCEQMGIFDNDLFGNLFIRQLTDAEAAEVAGSPFVDQAMARLADLKRKHGPLAEPPR